MRLDKLLFGLALPALAAAQSGCGQLTAKGSLDAPGAGPARNLGCIQGVVVDGLTGKTLNLTNFDAGKGEGLRVLVGDTTLTPGGASDAALTAKDVAGHYTLCNIPLDESYPIVVTVPGYERIEGDVLVRSTIDSESKEATSDIAKLVPMQTVNLRLYPVGVQTSDLKFVVTEGGLPQAGAHVILAPSGGNTLDDERFLVPHNVSAAPLTADTDAQGAAVFAGKDLVLGAAMDYRVIPATTAVQQTVANGKIHVGLLSLTEVQHPYLVYVDLNNPLPALAQVSSNLDDNDYVTSGELLIYFNREIEQVPGTRDDLIATLANANGAELKPDVKGNDQSDSVNIEITGNVLHLTPNWNVVPDPKTEGGLVVKFSGLRLRPKTSPGTADAKLFDDLAVKIFGGVTPPQIPTSFGVPAESGNSQSANANSDLALPVAVRVLDQFGKSYKTPFALTFTVTTGNGTVRAPDTGSDGAYATFRTTTDATGLARATWRLGPVNGTQSVTVSGEGLKPVTFNATANPILRSMALVRGAAQTAPANADTPDAVEVSFVDQNGEPYRSPVKVTFSVDPLVGGGVRAVGTTGTSLALDVQTNTDGRAAVLWTLGNRSGAQQLKITSGGFTQTATATAQAVFKSVQKLSGDNLAIGPNTDLDLIVQLKDQEGKDLRQENKVVTFQVATSISATLRAAGATGTGTATTLPVQTTPDGRAKVTFHLANNSVGAAIQVFATVDGVTETFTGTVKAQATVLDRLNDRQVAKVGTELPVPFTVQLKDQDGQNLKQPNVQVTFTVSTTGGVTGNLRRPDLSAGVPTTITVLTDAAGEASAFLTVTAPAAAGSYEVTATPDAVAVPGVAAVKFTGTFAP